MQIILWNSYSSVHKPIRTLASYQLASWLRGNNYTVKVIEFCHAMTTAELVAITEKYIDSETIAIGASSTFWYPMVKEWIEWEPDWVLNAREIIEQKFSNVSWLLGGWRAQSSQLKRKWQLFHGFSEDSLLKWLDEKTVSKYSRKPFDIKSCTMAFAEDDYIRANEPLPLETGRGCAFRCKFCGYLMNGKKPGTYIKEMELIKHQLLVNYERWGTTNYFYIDDTVNENPDKIRQLAEIAQSLPFQLKWVGFNRLDLIYTYPDLIYSLKDSGLVSSVFGVETFSRKDSLLIGKGWNGQHGKSFLQGLKKKWGQDINWHLSMIVGFPNEKKEVVIETVEWLIANNMYSWSYLPLFIKKGGSMLNPSEFEKHAEKYGFSFLDEKNPYEWTNSTWTFSQAVDSAKELNALSNDHKDIAAWPVLELEALGYDYKKMMSTKQSKLDLVELENKSSQFFSNYINFQLGL